MRRLHGKTKFISTMLGQFVWNDQDGAERGLGEANGVSKLGFIDFCFYLTMEADPVSQMSERF